MELLEFLKTKIVFEDEEKEKNVIGKIIFAFVKADEESKNKRSYSEKLVKREVELLNKKIVDSGIAGQLSHPSNIFTKLDKVSHVLTKIWYDTKEKLAFAEAKILATTKGKDLKVLIQQNLQGLGASMRGTGTVGDDKKVKEDWSLNTIDLVFAPAFDVAKISSANLIESGNKFFEESAANEITKEEENVIDEDKFALMLEKMLSTGFDRVGKEYSDFESFMDSSFDLYKKTLVEHILEEGFSMPWLTLAEEEGQIEEVEKKEENKLRNLYEEAVIAGTNLSFDEWKELHEKTADRNIVEHEKMYGLFEEYQIAGGNLPFSEWKKLFK